MSHITDNYIKIPSGLVTPLLEGTFVDPMRIGELENFLKSAKLNQKL